MSGATAADLRKAEKRLLKYALAFPEAYEDHPWGENVAKVAKKVFVFFGSEGSPYWPGMTVKLRESHQAALGVPGAEPTGYGLGRSGWVSLTFRAEGLPPVAVLRDWIEESYRIVAPKKLVAELDARGPH